MESLTKTLLEFWRLAASHWRLDDVIGEIALGLRRHVPCERLLILNLDQEQARLKPAAEFGVPESSVGQEPDPTPPFGPLRLWCLGDDLAQGRVQEVRQRLPGLVPARWTGGVLAVGLAIEQEPLGAIRCQLSWPVSDNYLVRLVVADL
jgi:hypothetical protein